MNRGRLLMAFVCLGGMTFAEEVNLFNNKDLTGWDGPPGVWTVENGALVAQSTLEKPCKTDTYLVWKGETPSDYELSADFRLSAHGNSGIQIRSEALPQWKTSGYQADMTGDGSLVGFVYHHKRGLIAGRGQRVHVAPDGSKTSEKIATPEELLKSFKPGDWNTYRIVCSGPEITLYVNSVMMCQFTDKDSKFATTNGVIALQMHPGPPMKIEFKNIILKKEVKGKNP
jgi:hypothetical protein